MIRGKVFPRRISSKHIQANVRKPRSLAALPCGRRALGAHPFPVERASELVEALKRFLFFLMALRVCGNLLVSYLYPCAPAGPPTCVGLTLDTRAESFHHLIARLAVVHDVQSRFSHRPTMAIHPAVIKQLQQSYHQ